GALGHGTARLVLDRLVLLAALDVDRGEALALQRLALCAEHALPGLDVRRRRVVHGRHELARQEAFPDQSVERLLILGEEARQRLRVARYVGRTDGLVRFLRAAARLVHRRRLGQVLRAQTLARPAARLGLCLLRDAHRIAAHIRDQTGGALVAELHAPVDVLGHRQRLPRRQAQLAAAW